MNWFTHDTNPALNLITQAILNSLWQGIVLAALTGLLLRAFKRTNAATRFTVWWITLFAVAALPVISAVGYSAKLTAAAETLHKESPAVLAPKLPVAGDTSSQLNRLPESEGSAPSSALTTEQEEVTKPSHSEIGRIPFIFELSASSVGRWPVFLFAGWLLGAGLFAVRICVAYGRLQTLKRSSVPLPAEQEQRFNQLLQRNHLGRRVRLRSSHQIATPLAAGFGNPVILIPQSLVERLSMSELTQVCLHELAHLRRWDDWTNLAQQLLAAVLFFHPAVLWIGRRLNLEREIACDDWVISATGETKPYALCLTKLAELTTPSASLLAPGALITRTQLGQRIRLLLDRKRNASNRISRVGCVSALGLVVCAVFASLQISALITIAAPAPQPRLAGDEPQAEQPDAPTTSALAKVAPSSDPLQEEHKPELTERDYLEEEIKIAEEQLHNAQMLANTGKGSNDDVLKMKREVLGLKRQLAAQNKKSTLLDLTVPNPKPQNFSQRLERIVSRPGSATDEPKAEAEGQGRPAETGQSELLASLVGVAKSDSDGQIRDLAIRSIGRLDTDIIIGPLSEIVLKDSAPPIRELAIRTIAGRRNNSSTEGLLKIYDRLEDTEFNTGFKKLIIQNFLETEQRLSNGRDAAQSVTVVPTRAIPKLMQIAKESPYAELRLAAVEQLGVAAAQPQLQNPGLAEDRRLGPVLNKRAPGSEGDLESRGKVYIYGQVRTAGAQEIPTDEPLTVTEAIIKAGGFTNFANKKKVRITRDRGPGQDPQLFFLDLGKISEQSSTELEPGDIVFVPARLLNY